MGAEIEATDGRFPPFVVRGARLQAIDYELPVASAQVKSCVLLAALTADGATTVVEPAPSRDHTERMLAARRRHRPPHGQPAVRDERRRALARRARGARRPLARPPSRSPPRCSSRARGSSCAGVGVNWTRTGFIRILQRMGGIVLGDLEEDPATSSPTTSRSSDLDVAAGPLVGTVVEPEEVPLAIDELPLVALLGCFAEGETVVKGAEELRVKESDRIATVVDGPARPRRRHRGDRGRLRRPRHRRPARRHDQLPRRPPPGHARRGRRHGVARGRRGRSGWRPPRCRTPGSSATARQHCPDRDRRDRRPRRGRQVHRRPRRRRRARLHLPRHRRDVPLRRAGRPGPRPVDAGDRLRRRARPARRARRQRRDPHARGRRRRPRAAPPSRRSAPRWSRASRRCSPTATGSPRVATSGRSSRRTPS